MPTLFLCYRRSDTELIVGSIHDKLESRFGKSSVFYDQDDDSIPVGERYPDLIENAIRQSEIMLALIGKDWLETGLLEHPRLFDSHDEVRTEIEAALKHKVNLIPVLINKARMPDRDKLPVSLQELCALNASAVYAGRDFHPHMERLVQRIEDMLDSRKSSNKLSEPSEVDSRAAATAPAVDPVQTALEALARIAKTRVASSAHRFENGVCTRCGNSEQAATRFQWSCKADLEESQKKLSNARVRPRKSKTRDLVPDAEPALDSGQLYPGWIPAPVLLGAKTGLGRYSLSWSAIGNAEIYILQRAFRPDWSDAVEVYQGSRKGFEDCLYGFTRIARQPPAYYRVKARGNFIVTPTESLWSNVVVL